MLKVLILSVAILVFALATTARCQIFGTCTPDSMSVAKAGALSAVEAGRWNCMARNLDGVRTLPLSHIGFKMDFTELHMLDTADVIDIFTQKQKMTKPAKAARAIEWFTVGAGIVAAISGVPISARLVGALGAAAYGSSKFSQYLTQQIPSTQNDLARMWGPADVVMLRPGEAIEWKEYASKMHGAKELGIRSLTMVGSEPGIPLPPQVAPVVPPKP